MLQVSFWIPEIGRFVLEGIFLSLFVIFPRRLFRARWPWIVIWAPWPQRFPGASRSSMRPSTARAKLQPFRPGSIRPLLRTIVYLVAGIAILVVGYRRLLDPNEKRRVRVLMAGTANYGLLYGGRGMASTRRWEPRVLRSRLPAREIVMVLNWFEQLKRLVPSR